MSRPSKIKKIDLSLVEYLGEEGYTDKQLADIFCVDERTINNWKKAYPLFFQSIKKGKMLADAKVEASLFQRATGYSHPAVKIMPVDGEVVEVPYIKHYPPDGVSCMFWLKNRQPDKWRDKREVGVSDTEIPDDEIVWRYKKLQVHASKNKK